MANPKGPNPVDRHVGARIRLQRRAIRTTQQKLADVIGIAVQQVQKYEKGASALSVGMPTWLDDRGRWSANPETVVRQIDAVCVCSLNGAGH